MIQKNILVRLATSEDIPAILRIMQDAFSYYARMAGIDPGAVQALSETYEDIEKDLTGKIVLVAEVEGEIAGSVRLETMADGSVYFSRFGVLKQYKGMKIGDLLFEAVDEYMVESGSLCLCLHTASSVLALIRFYYAKGFVIESADSPRGYRRVFLCKYYENCGQQPSSIAF
jgi:ribosomal protein S18 acetylase RimI-like enzyme